MNDDEREVLSKRAGEYQDLIAQMVHLWPWQLYAFGATMFVSGAGAGVFIAQLIP